MFLVFKWNEKTLSQQTFLPDYLHLQKISYGFQNYKPLNQQNNLKPALVNTMGYVWANIGNRRMIHYSK